MCLIVPLNLLALIIHLDESIQETKMGWDHLQKGDAFMPNFFGISFTCMVVVSMAMLALASMSEFTGHVNVCRKFDTGLHVVCSHRSNTI